MSLFKTMRCRYFDEHARPVKPYCAQGRRCRFVHPSDSNWATSGRRGEKVTHPRKDSLKTTQKSDFKRESSLSCRSTALMSQGGSNDSISRHLPRGREVESRKAKDHHGDHSADGSIRGYDSHDRRDDEESIVQGRSALVSVDYGKRDHGSDNCIKIGCPVDPTQERAPEKLLTAESATISTDSGVSFRQQNKNAATAEENSSETLLFFRRLFELTNHTLQDSSACNQEAEKMKTFTDLSSGLSKVAPSAANAVAPALAASITKHCMYKERLNAGLNEMESLWENIFGMFSKRIVKVIDENLERALAILKQESDSIASGSKSALKRKASDEMTDADVFNGSARFGEETSSIISDQRENVVDAEYCHTTLDHEKGRELKRRRLTSSPVEHDGHAKKEDPAMDFSIRGILEEMKAKLDLQTRTLEMLRKEKDQTKYTVQTHSASPYSRIEKSANSSEVLSSNARWPYRQSHPR